MDKLFNCVNGDLMKLINKIKILLIAKNSPRNFQIGETFKVFAKSGSKL